jgi:hypothetical protein
MHRVTGIRPASGTVVDAHGRLPAVLD